MDKNTTTGLILIGAVVIAFMYLNKPQEPQKTEQVVTSKSKSKENSETEIDEPVTENKSEISNIETLDSNDLVIYQKLKEQKKKEDLIERYGVFFTSAEGTEEILEIQNNKIKLSFSSRGGRITSASMVEVDNNGSYKYKTYDNFIDEINQPLSLFEKQTSFMSLTLVDNEKVVPVETKDLFFKVAKHNDSSVVFRAYANSTKKYLEFAYKLSKNSYDVSFNIDYHNIANDIKPDVDLKWSMYGLSTEKLASDERNTCTVMYKYFGATRDYLSETSNGDEELDANIHWIAFKHKFFSSILLSNEGLGKSKIRHELLENENYTDSYYLRSSIPSMGKVSLKFLFVPNDYDLLETYNAELEDLINLGWDILTWISRYFIDPIFLFLMDSGLSIGITILILTIIVKLVIMPLTYKNYMSTAKTKVLKPEITKINSKYEGKTDRNAVMKKQQETMALYKQTGVSPMAGCIPMIIQAPILFAVFKYFPASLELRHKGFFWADDLSSYDSILDFGFNIPVYGDHISLFAILMAASTLIYTITNSSQMAQSTQPGMPNMKVIMYMMPIFLLFVFNSYSSGLCFYYFCGNLMNIGIMWGIKNYLIDENKIRLQIESNKKKKKKKSRFQQRLEEVAKQQQKKRR
jgi:YidC/Oxa1 family membrane protein insertase